MAALPAIFSILKRRYAVMTAEDLVKEVKTAKTCLYRNITYRQICLHQKPGYPAQAQIMYVFNIVLAQLVLKEDREIRSGHAGHGRCLRQGGRRAGIGIDIGQHTVQAE